MATPVNFVWNSNQSALSVRTWVMSSLATILHRWGYQIEGTSQESTRFVRRRSFWTMALISPLAFLVSPYEKNEVVVTIIPCGPSATRMTVLGELPKKIAQVLEQLPQAPVKVS